MEGRATEEEWWKGEKAVAAANKHKKDEDCQDLLDILAFGFDEAKVR